MKFTFSILIRTVNFNIILNLPITKIDRIDEIIPIEYTKILISKITLSI